MTDQESESDSSWCADDFNESSSPSPSAGEGTNMQKISLEVGADLDELDDFEDGDEPLTVPASLQTTQLSGAYSSSGMDKRHGSMKGGPTLITLEDMKSGAASGGRAGPLQVNEANSSKIFSGSEDDEFDGFNDDPCVVSSCLSQIESRNNSKSSQEKDSNGPTLISLDDMNDKGKYKGALNLIHNNKKSSKPGTCFSNDVEDDLEGFDLDDEPASTSMSAQPSSGGPRLITLEDMNKAVSAGTTLPSTSGIKRAKHVRQGSEVSEEDCFAALLDDEDDASANNGADNVSRSSKLNSSCKKTQVSCKHDAVEEDWDDAFDLDDDDVALSIKIQDKSNAAESAQNLEQKATGGKVVIPNGQSLSQKAVVPSIQEGESGMVYDESRQKWVETCKSSEIEVIDWGDEENDGHRDENADNSKGSQGYNQNKGSTGPRVSYSHKRRSTEEDFTVTPELVSAFYRFENCHNSFFKNILGEKEYHHYLEKFSKANSLEPRSSKKGGKSSQPRSVSPQRMSPMHSPVSRRDNIKPPHQSPKPKFKKDQPSLSFDSSAAPYRIASVTKVGSRKQRILSEVWKEFSGNDWTI